MTYRATLRMRHVAGTAAEERRSTRFARVSVSGVASRLLGREMLIPAGLVLVAVLLRLPYLWQIPELTDETLESIRAYNVYLGKVRALHSVAHYIGPFNTYVEAAAFWLFGVSIYAGRALVGVLGALAVVTTYLLAREMLGARLAVVTAALLATSAVHIGGNSHVNWSQMTAPLFLALAFMLLYRAAERRSGGSLLGAGFVFGLGLQTAMTNVAYLPGAALYLLLRWPGALRSRWPYLATLGFGVGYLNMLVYNLSTGFESLKAGQARDAAYSEYEARDLNSYLENLGRVLTTVTRFPSGAVDARETAMAYLADPVVLLYAGLTVAGVVLLARRGNTLPLLVMLSTILIMPIFGAQHELLPRQGRYLSSLLPLIYTALTFAVWQLGTQLMSRHVRWGPSRFRGSLATLGLLALVLAPLVPLQRYYADELTAGRTNQRFYDLLADIEASRFEDEFVLLDFALAQERLGGGGTALRTIHSFLTLRAVPHDDLTLDRERLARRYPRGGILLVMTARSFRSLATELPLQPVRGASAIEPPSPYGIYRLGPLRES